MPDDFRVPIGPFLNGRIEHADGIATLVLLRGTGPAHRSLEMIGIDQILTMISSIEELDDLGGEFSAKDAEARR